MGMEGENGRCLWELYNSHILKSYIKLHVGENDEIRHIVQDGKINPTTFTTSIIGILDPIHVIVLKNTN